MQNTNISYILLIENKRQRKIKIGGLGQLQFKKGEYLYVGSGKCALLARIRRHLSRHKNIFWHIDYFLKSGNVKIRQIWLSSDSECSIAKAISNYGQAVERFGCSDCRCNSHFFYMKNPKKVKDILKNRFKRYKK